MRDLTAEAREPGQGRGTLYTINTTFTQGAGTGAVSRLHRVLFFRALPLDHAARRAAAAPAGACAVPHPQTRIFHVLGGAYITVRASLLENGLRLNALCTLILYRGLCSPVIHP